ncbi:Chitinase [Colletotrichum higginsianum IMI 349063]|uniref:Chitinase n=1 Tax=Colletotrichum higginsianum (strain IMI 349063) TaxID=759273 RepID=A0A1B7Y7R4_COLHI|nr:Chitinase [Colletotrichum higginsianum IMI 349063]OBR08076.1 Chitinase [Colletotrichum higginsianum IMI 349063]GJC97834.1 chitinase [Colletotrichum higginsianum]
MEKHIENPTCPATILRPVLGDMFTNVKGSLEFEASLTRTLQGKTTNCEMDRYWIGPTPGVAGGNDIYRDPYMANGGPQDRWVVFHMHIDEGTQWLRTINGRTHVGIRSVQVFHGYESNVRGNTAWRVENTDGRRNSRDGLTCEEEEAVWYPGADVELPIGTGTESDDVFYRQFQQWGDRLFNDSYMGSRALELLLSCCKF